MMRWLIVNGTILLLLALFLACATPESRAQKACIKELKSREYETTREVFIAKFNDNGEIVLAIPGNSSVVPISVESYRKYGKKWATDPLYRKNQMFESYKTEVLAIVPVGTRFRITKLKEEPFIVPYWEIYGQLDLALFDKKRIDISCMFDEDGLFHIRPKEGYVREVMK
ncbi:MAG: hypothetical protein JSR80_06450 [Verrucomicrobia bacterium]|nr:hypothetical protein [Verrucomicrobiota bacterium]